MSIVKKFIALSSVGLLALGCGNEVTETFVAQAVQVPVNDDEATLFGNDYNGDGVVDTDDNALGDLAIQLEIAGIDIQGLLSTAVADGVVLIAADITSKNFKDDANALVTAFLAAEVDGNAPAFNGEDALVVEGDTFDFNGVVIADGKVTTDKSDFVFALPLDPENPTLLTLKNSILTGTIDIDNKTIADASLSGTVEAVEFAAALGGVGDLVVGLLNAAAIEFGGDIITCIDGDAAPCDAIAAGGVCTDQNADLVETGVCVDAEANAGILGALALIDGNQNGLIEVEFDANEGIFVENELALLFNIAAPGASPVGLIGGLFKLDLDENDENDAIGLGIGFDAVGAVRQ